MTNTGQHVGTTTKAVNWRDPVMVWGEKERDWPSSVWYITDTSQIILISYKYIWMSQEMDDNGCCKTFCCGCRKAAAKLCYYLPNWLFLKSISRLVIWIFPGYSQWHQAQRKYVVAWVDQNPVSSPSLCHARHPSLTSTMTPGDESPLTIQCQVSSMNTADWNCSCPPPTKSFHY